MPDPQADAFIEAAQAHIQEKVRSITQALTVALRLREMSVEHGAETLANRSQPIGDMLAATDAAAHGLTALLRIGGLTDTDILMTAQDVDREDLALQSMEG